MASLSIRRLDEEIYDRLRARAEQRGVSMEEEARRILTHAVAVPDRLGDLFLKAFRLSGGVDLELPEQEPHEPLDLLQP